MLFKKKIRKEIDYQIEQFKEHRRYFSTTSSHIYWLNQFAKITGMEDVNDIKDYDVVGFLDALKDIRGSEFARFQAQAALRIFMAFAKQNGMIKTMAEKKKMGRPEKEARNKEMVQKRLKNPTRWTIRKIGAHYGIKESTVFDILERHGAVKNREVIHK